MHSTHLVQKVVLFQLRAAYQFKGYFGYCLFKKSSYLILPLLGALFKLHVTNVQRSIPLLVLAKSAGAQLFVKYHKLFFSMHC